MAYILGVQILYRLIYRKASMILVNNMCMLLSISMIILTRLSVSKAMSQYKILAASTLLCFIIPVIVRKGKFLKNLTWIYAVLGIAMLSVVMVLGFYFRRCEAVDRNPRYYVPALRDCQDHTRVLYGRHAARG